MYVFRYATSNKSNVTISMTFSNYPDLMAEVAAVLQTVCDGPEAFSYFSFYKKGSDNV